MVYHYTVAVPGDIIALEYTFLQYLDVDEERITPTMDSKEYFTAAPALARCNRQLRREVYPIFYETNIFYTTRPQDTLQLAPFRSTEILNFLTRLNLGLRTSYDQYFRLFFDFDLCPSEVSAKIEEDHRGQEWYKFFVVWRPYILMGDEEPVSREQMLEGIMATSAMKISHIRLEGPSVILST